MPPTSLGAVRSAHDGLMTQVATVYIEDDVTGLFTKILRQNMPCRLVRPANTAPGTRSDRAELLADRDLWWSGDIHLPEQCMFLINGVYWQPAPGTFVEVGDGQTVVANKCAVVRQQTVAFT